MSNVGYADAFPVSSPLVPLNLRATKPSGKWFRNGRFNGVTVSNSSTTAGRIYYTREVLEVETTISSFGGVTATTAAGTGSYAIYGETDDGLPGDLLYTIGNVSLASSGDRGIAVSPEVVLPPGVYYFALWQSLAVQWKALADTAAFAVFRSGATRDVATAVSGFYEVLAWTGTFPAQASGSLTENNVQFAFYW